jgi:hypothetical protein
LDKDPGAYALAWGLIAIGILLAVFMAVVLA